MDPITMGLILGLSLLSGVVQSAGLGAAAKETEILAERNSLALERRANDARERGKQQMAVYRERAVELQGRQAVAYAASGVDVGLGTAGVVQASTKLLAETDVAIAENNADREAWGFKEQASIVREQGQVEARQLRRQAVGSLLGTLGSVAGTAIGEFAPVKS